jgi:pyridoxine/pyridoxamine 5'-phosphate oxidase
MTRNPEQTIGSLIDKQGVSFIASVDADGFPNMKAMLPPRKREGLRKFWFTTNTSSVRVAQYRENPHASIYFCDKRFFRGVMLPQMWSRLPIETMTKLQAFSNLKPSGMLGVCANMRNDGFDY